jgi:CheY-like chemotaxis protein
MKTLGGSCAIEALPGYGTTVTLTLPLPDSNDRVVSDVSTPACGGRITRAAVSPPSASGSRHRVLVVDDHAMMRQGLRSVLEQYADVDIVGEASTGVEAIAAVQASHPSIIIMDVNMPELDGAHATQRIKEQHPEIGIIGISVNVDHDQRLAMKKAGAAMLIAKEAAVDQIYEAIQYAARPNDGEEWYAWSNAATIGTVSSDEEFSLPLPFDQPF